MKNKIEDLRNHLFAQLERLGDDEAMESTEARQREIERAKAIAEVSNVIVNSAKAETAFLRVTGQAADTGFIPLNRSNSKQLATTSN